ncbi:hypothetical protein chiPu_0027546 [Chiloscyllium punctatum]|uniref:Uncharacterized protein n=1 Tax=Chiloscyllium punctatum TaxID=137246 RepID=A0A401TL62_CHIPU|nr:hypothetical protein [Chiloscyllium punctatum]
MAIRKADRNLKQLEGFQSSPVKTKVQHESEDVVLVGVLPTVPPTPREITVKVRYRGEIYRVPMKVNPLSFVELKISFVLTLLFPFSSCFLFLSSWSVIHPSHSFPVPPFCFHSHYMSLLPTCPSIIPHTSSTLSFFLSSSLPLLC